MEKARKGEYDFGLSALKHFFFMTSDKTNYIVVLKRILHKKISAIATRNSQNSTRTLPTPAEKQFIYMILRSSLFHLPLLHTPFPRHGLNMT